MITAGESRAIPKPFSRVRRYVFLLKLTKFKSAREVRKCAPEDADLPRRSYCAVGEVAEDRAAQSVCIARKPASCNGLTTELDVRTAGTHPPQKIRRPRLRLLSSSKRQKLQSTAAERRRVLTTPHEESQPMQKLESSQERHFWTFLDAI